MAQDHLQASSPDVQAGIFWTAVGAWSHIQNLRLLQLLTVMLVTASPGCSRRKYATSNPRTEGEKKTGQASQLDLQRAKQLKSLWPNMQHKRLRVIVLQVLSLSWINEWILWHEFVDKQVPKSKAEFRTKYGFFLKPTVMAAVCWGSMHRPNVISWSCCPLLIWPYKGLDCQLICSYLETISSNIKHSPCRSIKISNFRSNSSVLSSRSLKASAILSFHHWNDQKSWMPESRRNQQVLSITCSGLSTRWIHQRAKPTPHLNWVTTTGGLTLLASASHHGGYSPTLLDDENVTDSWRAAATNSSLPHWPQLRYCY